MIFRITLTFSILWLTFLAQSQTNGFLGKRNFVSIQGRFYTPLTNNAIKNDLTKLKSNSEETLLYSRRNIAEVGANILLGRTIADNFSIAIQVGVLSYNFIMANIDGQYSSSQYINQAFFNSNLPPDSYNTNYFGATRASMLTARQTYIMPILEFSNNGGLLPIGLSHQLGFGIHSNKLVKKANIAEISLNNSNGNQFSTLITSEDLYDYDSKGIRSYSLMYKINLRIPISRSLLYNLGFRYNLNFYGSYANDFFSTTPEPGGALYTRRSIANRMRSNQIANLMSLEMGLTYIF